MFCGGDPGADAADEAELLSFVLCSPGPAARPAAAPPCAPQLQADLMRPVAASSRAVAHGLTARQSQESQQTWESHERGGAPRAGSAWGEDAGREALWGAKRGAGAFVHSRASTTNLPRGSLLQKRPRQDSPQSESECGAYMLGGVQRMAHSLLSSLGTPIGSDYGEEDVHASKRLRAL